MTTKTSNQQAIFKEIERLKTENEIMRAALKQYADSRNWRFAHDESGRLVWVTSLGFDLATETLEAIKPKASDGTLTIKKGK